LHTASPARPAACAGEGIHYAADQGEDQQHQQAIEDGRAEFAAESSPLPTPSRTGMHDGID
jgi:hypothetical protein